MELLQFADGFVLWLAFILLLELVQLVLLIQKKLFTNPDHKLPPGPRAWPIIGNLLQAGPIPHEKTREMNNRFGPLVFLRLGRVPAVVTDDPCIVRSLLRCHDESFASRPATAASEHFTFGGRDIAFAEHGEHWRDMRRLCTLELLSPRRLAESRTGRSEEASLMVRSIFEDHKRMPGGGIVLRDRFGELASNNLTRMLLARRFFGAGDATAEDSATHKRLIYDAFSLINAFNVGDYLPFLRWMDLQGHERRMRSIMRRTNAIYDAIIDEHRNRNRSSGSSSERKPDFVDTLIAMRKPNGKCLSDTVIKAILIDMMAAGTDTTSITSEWIMAELMQHPRSMRKVLNEIDTVVGKDRCVEECDLPHFRYLRCCVKEVLRLHPVGAFLIPHVSTGETSIQGYHIPRGTRALINTFALGRNPKVWPHALEFRPERFWGDESLFDSECRMVPFGSGRRGCPGATLGTCMVMLGVARLIHGFDWSLPQQQQRHGVDMRLAHNSVILNSPLQLVPSPRLPEHLY